MIQVINSFTTQSLCHLSLCVSHLGPLIQNRSSYKLHIWWKCSPCACSWYFITLRAKLSRAVYCYWSCLWVCGCVCMWVCGSVTLLPW